MPTVESSLTTDSVIIGPRLRHHRSRDHFGTQDDTTVVLSTAIGPYAEGTVLHTILVGLFNSLNEINSSATNFGQFTWDVFVQPYFRANAAKIKEQTGSFTANARYGIPATLFSADAIRRSTPTGSFIAYAYVVP